MLFQRKHLLVALQMEARWRVEAIDALVSCAELADNELLGGGRFRLTYVFHRKGHL
jgi:hypothetical protein